MGLTYQSQGRNAIQKNYQETREKGNKNFVVALAGNPNTGKSTVFNALTGLNQHTGNWPGKTVVQVQGTYTYSGKTYTLVDLPGTYSLFANSVEEQVARDYICFGKPDATVVVVDATCLERNLNLVLQVMEITPKVVVCVNLLDEAKRKKLVIDLDKLQRELGVPVVGTIARNGMGLEKLKHTVAGICTGKTSTTPKLPRYREGIEQTIEKTIPQIIEKYGGEVNPRWLALRILEGDTSILNLRKNDNTTQT